MTDVKKQVAFADTEEYRKRCVPLAYVKPLLDAILEDSRIALSMKLGLAYQRCGLDVSDPATLYALREQTGRSIKQACYRIQRYCHLSRIDLDTTTTCNERQETLQ